MVLFNRRPSDKSLRYFQIVPSGHQSDFFDSHFKEKIWQKQVAFLQICNLSVGQIANLSYIQ